MKVLLFSLLMFTAGGCATSSNGRDGQGDSLWMEKIAEKDECIGAYREKIRLAFEGKIPNGSPGEIREHIWLSLPPQEREIIVRVADNNLRGKIAATNELRMEIIGELHAGFVEKRICSKIDPLGDMYLFADAIRAHLLRNNIWTDDIFRTDWDSDGTLDSGQRILLALSLEAATDAFPDEKLPAN